MYCGVAPIELLPDRQLCTLLHIVVDHKVNSLWKNGLGNWRSDGRIVLNADTLSITVLLNRLVTMPYILTTIQCHVYSV